MTLLEPAESRRPLAAAAQAVPPSVAQQAADMLTEDLHKFRSVRSTISGVCVVCACRPHVCSPQPQITQTLHHHRPAATPETDSCRSATAAARRGVWSAVWSSVTSETAGSASAARHAHCAKSRQCLRTWSSTCAVAAAAAAVCSVASSRACHAAEQQMLGSFLLGPAALPRSRMCRAAAAAKQPQVSCAGAL
jgi:hypothetical protein